MYLTLSDIQTAVREDVLLHLVDDEDTRTLDVTDGTPQRQRIEQAIADAGDEVDSYLAQRYTLPLVTAPRAVLARALDIAIYNLWKRRGIRPGTADETVKTAYRDAVNWLKAVAGGQATLPLPSIGAGDPAAAEDSVGAIAIASRPKRGW